MTSAQQKLKEKHGTPDEFAAACRRAYADLFITWAELMAGIAKYEREWEAAGVTAPATDSSAPT